MSFSLDPGNLRPQVDNLSKIKIMESQSDFFGVFLPLLVLIYKQIIAFHESRFHELDQISFWLRTQEDL